MLQTPTACRETTCEQEHSTIRGSNTGVSKPLFYRIAQQPSLLTIDLISKLTQTLHVPKAGLSLVGLLKLANQGSIRRDRISMR